MKIAIYPTLESIPEADRADYKLETATGSPNFNKYVLDLDPAHPVALKNAELLGEKATKDATHATELQAKATQIQSLTAELEVARTSSLPAGQVAVPVEDFQTFQKYKALGAVEEVATKVTEHTALKEENALHTVTTQLEEIAERNGMDKKAFVKLGLPVKIQDLLETTELPDGKGGTVKHDLVKTKDDKGADAKIAITEYVKANDAFSPFLNSLFLSDDQKKKIKIPDNNSGNPPAAKSVAAAYINRTYKPAEKKTE